MELARRTWRELGDDFAVDLAASISYYALLSLFPLAIGLVSLFSLILEADVVETGVFGFFHTYLPGSEGLLKANVEAVEDIRGLLGIFSAVGLLWSSSLLFGSITRAVNRAWDIPYDWPFYIEKPRHFIMACTVAPLVVLSVVLTTGLQVLSNDEWPVLEHLAFLEHNGINTLARPLPFVFSLAIFLLIYKFAPYTTPAPTGAMSGLGRWWQRCSLTSARAFSCGIWKITPPTRESTALWPPLSCCWRGPICRA